MNKPLDGTQVVKPWTQDQFNDMIKLRDITLPALKDMLSRNKKAGLDVSQLEETVKENEKRLIGMIDAWKDVYS